MRILDRYREYILNYLFNINSFSNAWENSWKEMIEEILSNREISNEKLFELGSMLREIFFSTRGENRGQGDVSAAGTAWECLVAWYLNLGLIGTRTIVIKPKKEFNFECIQNSITVNYGEFISSSESDLIAITFPKEEEIAYPLSELERFHGREFDIEELKNPENLEITEIRDYLNSLLENNISKVKVNVLQCKTNWNDNAQIPMGWDMIYSSTGFQQKNINVGRENFSIHKLREFKYTFITVPTQKNLENSFKSDSTAVLRVRNLSGKNFWGLPSKENVAYSIGEIFNLNYFESFNERPLKNRLIEFDIEKFKIF